MDHIILGATIHTNLKFQEHINQITKQANQRANLIHRCFISRDLSNFTRAFITYVRPMLEYNSPVWSPFTKHMIEAIEAVQRSFTKQCYFQLSHGGGEFPPPPESQIPPKKSTQNAKKTLNASNLPPRYVFSPPRARSLELTLFTKRIPGLQNFTYGERLAKLNIQSLEHRRLMTDLTTCFNIVHGFSSLSFDDFFTFATNRFITRGHAFKLIIPLDKSNIRKYFFS